MLKILILFALTLNIAFAKSRFTDADKTKFMEEVKQGIAAHKIENKGNVDLQIIKPGLYEELDVYYKQEKFTREEMVKIKQRYEEFSRNPSITPAKAEEEFYKFVQTQLDEINKTQVPKTKEGQVCNSWSCEEGLKCAPDPKQEDGQSCKKEGKECKEDKDCCSTSCTLDKKSNKRFCEEAYRCFRPLALGQACSINPVCGEGECLAFNSRTSGIGECEERGSVCKSNSDCCSNSCSGNKCVDSYICKDCVKNGKKPDRGQKCCEGLYLNEKGTCVPDVPPTVFPEVNYSILKSTLVAIVEFVFPVAHAEDDQNLLKLQSEFKSKLTPSSNGDGESGFMYNNGGTSVFVKSETDYKSVADANPEIRKDWVTRLGIDPSDTNYAGNRETISTAFQKTDAPPNSRESLNVASGLGTFTAVYDYRGRASSIETPFGTMAIGEFFKSNVYAALTGSHVETGAAKLAGEAADKAALAEIMQADKDAKQAALDNADMTGTINADRSKYANFRAESEAVDKVAVKTPEMKFTRKSDFTTCDIKFRDDYANYLKTAKLIDLELALLAFDYTLLGNGVNDYWTRNSDPSTSIYGRLKSVAKNHQALRTAQNVKMDVINKKLTCMCLDVKGYKEIKDEAKKTFFEKECSEYAKYADPATTFDELEGDASGVKGKRLLVAWTKNLESFNASLAIDNTEAYKGIAEVSNWAAYEAKWNEAENRTYTLFNFNIKNPSGSVAAMGAILGALLAAGVIAILGGFASTSILTAWAAAGIIATSAITGGTGLWLIASLKGAWVTKRPEIFDKYIRSYGCGKKETCVEYSRELNQPYNKICKVHTSANACIKNFVVYYLDGEPRYLVDPWIPKDVERSLVLRDSGDAKTYAEKMEDGFQAAKSHMIAKNPGASGGGGKGGGAFVSEDYMRTLFVDSGVLGKYVPNIGLDDKRFIMNSTIIKDIKEKAKKYALEERFFESTDTDNLAKFADYAYQYHFIWPKTSRLKEISYPTVGLTTYLDLMSNGVTANMAVGATNAAKTFGGLNTKYLQDYLNTLQVYQRALPINQAGDARLKLLNAEIAKVQSELENQTMFNSLANNTSLDSQLLNLNSGVNLGSKLTGGKGDVVLTGDQAKFLNAIGTLRVARKAQLKKLDTFKKAIAKNGNPERAAKIASASKSFGAKFSSPLSGSSGKGGSSIFGSGGLDGLGSKGADDANSDANSDSNSRNNSGDANGANRFGSGTGALFGSGSGRSGKSGSGGDNANANGADANGGANGDGAGVANGNGVSDEDARKLAEAIEARNRANQDKYKSNGNMTIFEQVTNAYIRNYDKVLVIKKKDKDIIEQK
ncbi:MAG: hypothetical protein WC635_08635 [Bacteriovorax sp.]|jgi:hypothetical protein